MGKDDVDKLSRDNYEDWFRRQKAILKGKRVFYTLEKTILEFAYVREIGDTTGPEVVIPLPPSPTLGGFPSAHDAAVDAITEGISRLGGSWDERKKEQWEVDDAKALPIIMKGLGPEDAIFADSSETSAELWRQLKAKYEVTCTSTANEYVTKMQTFAFKKEIGIDGSWTLLKTYRRRIQGAKSFMKVSYPDEALLLVLTTALNQVDDYKSTLDGLAIRDDLSVEQKVKALQEKEHRLRESTPTATNAERANAARQRQRQGAPRTKKPDSTAADRKPKCFCCGSKDHLFGSCKYRSLVREQRIKDEEEEEEAKGTTRSKSSQSSSRSSQKNSRRGKKSHSAAHDSDSSADESSDDTDKSDETVMLSRKQMKT